MAQPVPLLIEGFLAPPQVIPNDGYIRVGLKGFDFATKYIECPEGATTQVGEVFQVDLPARLHFSDDPLPPAPVAPVFPHHPIHIHPVDPALVGPDGQRLNVSAPNHELQWLQGADKNGVTYGLVVRAPALGATPRGATKNTFVVAGLDVYSPADGTDPTRWTNPLSVWLTYAPLYDDFSLSCQWNNQIASIDLSLQGLGLDDQGNPDGTGKLTQSISYYGEAAGTWALALPPAGPIPMLMAADPVIWAAGERANFFTTAMSYICLEANLGFQGSPLTALIHPQTFQNEQDFVAKMLASVTPALALMAGSLVQDMPFLQYAAQYLGFLLTTVPGQANLVEVLNQAAQYLAEQQHYDYSPGHLLKYLPLKPAGSPASQALDGLWPYPVAAKLHRVAPHKDRLAQKLAT